MWLPPVTESLGAEGRFTPNRRQPVFFQERFLSHYLSEGFVNLQNYHVLPNLCEEFCKIGKNFGLARWTTRENGFFIIS